LGDAAAFDRLVRLYTPRLLWFVRTLGVSETAAEDVVQESWLAAWSSLNRLRQVASFRGWLYGIARHKSRQYAAKDRESIRSELDIACEAPDETYFDRYLPYLNAALERISIVHREVLALRFLEDLTYQELSRALGVPVGTIKSRLHNAKLALRAALEGLGND
jgi:RNA polymerase sigma-70 factor (ECF subfamily)